MGKSSKVAKSTSALPLTPLIYINDPQPNDDPQLNVPSLTAITAVIPATKVIPCCKQRDVLFDYYRSNESKETVVTILSKHSDDKDHKLRISLAKYWKEAAIKQGRNFASVNLYLQTGTPAGQLKNWGTNHLELNISQLSPAETAAKVYKWLFTVLSVPETLHLIPQSEMGELATDKRHFPHYAYCPISESRIRPKDAKIQFVALITSKPQVTPGNTNPTTGELEGSKLVWTVADRSGTATFYFLHRGPSSQPTWDWVLDLKPGDRKALPRMPSVAVTETTSIRIAKSPFRILGGTVSGTGAVIKGLGHGLSRVGDKLKMGKSKQWVAEADVRYEVKGKAWHKGDLRVRGGRHVSPPADAEKAESEKREIWEENVKREVKVFDEKGQRLWGDEDSLASTEGGGVVDCKEFA